MKHLNALLVGLFILLGIVSGVYLLYLLFPMQFYCLAFVIALFTSGASRSVGRYPYWGMW